MGKHRAMAGWIGMVLILAGCDKSPRELLARLPDAGGAEAEETSEAPKYPFQQPGTDPAEAMASFQAVKVMLLLGYDAGCEQALKRLVAFNRTYGRWVDRFLPTLESRTSWEGILPGVEDVKSTVADIQRTCPSLEYELLQALADHRKMTVKGVPPEDPLLAAVVVQMQRVIRVMSDQQEDCPALMESLGETARQQEAERERWARAIADRIGAMTPEEARWFAVELDQLAAPFTRDNAELMDRIRTRCPEAHARGLELLGPSSLAGLIRSKPARLE